MAAQKRIGVLTSGGDCPGLNAVLRGVVRAADNLNWQVVGFRDGFEGLLPPSDYIVLDRWNTAGIMHLGGTMLGTTNRGHFVAKVGSGSRALIPKDIIEKARQTLKDLDIYALIVVGGDGSMMTAQQLHEEGFRVIGVPKTIDNDLEATAMTFGFDSAVACVADALDRLHTTATSHKRVMVLEVMGRHAGWIALYGGLAGGADIILIPEIPFDL
ncbi:MAG: ATP-dependent 6-phosphofructokinase, partial [Chthoniobacterales bacterium]